MDDADLPWDGPCHQALVGASTSMTRRTDTQLSRKSSPGCKKFKRNPLGRATANCPRFKA
ncbi:MAG: hypothetical protein KA603_13845 [Azonexus sp.]|jgi:hypothetical protein|nr:hypothetical protein [Betaproteobacteria bacterium]MBK8916635.1 hypothetical protein [Betaproteobacteria bacterium]MBP6037205.1 hypothetical protein [Azonexus sp.]MBP6907759.1 hypothetical protein [Azonexus sp.]